MAGEDRTEKATPKRREEARKKGQVAKSMDLNGAWVLIAALLALNVFGGHMYRQMEAAMRSSLALIATPDVVRAEGVAPLLMETGRTVAVAVAPIAVACLLAGLVVSVLQVGVKPKSQAIKPDPKKLNPLTGAKNLFGPNMVFEGVKNVVKVSIVGGVVFVAVFPSLPELATLVGLPPGQLGSKLAAEIMGIAKRAAAAYLAIGFVDLVWQRHRNEKQLRMTKDEVKREAKEQAPPAEVMGERKRRQLVASRARMMAAVPGADVVVTNPTHFSVALKYDGSRGAPVVVAKGQDLVAFEIRRIAEEHGVPVVPDPPLARSLHATVDLDQEIPEELYQAVAQLLAFVYRVAGRSVA